MSKIVLIDDEVQSTDALATMLRLLGHEVATAVDARSGEIETRRMAPNLLITDMMLPGMSGLEFIAGFAQETPPVYSCLLTGMADYHLLKRAVEAGAWTLMSKPFALPDLLALIQTADFFTRLMKRQSHQPVSSAELRITSGQDVTLEHTIGTVSDFARSVGADEDTSMRRLPIVVMELLQNTEQHAAGEWVLSCRDDDGGVDVVVDSTTTGFDWRRELSRCHTNWTQSRASGLQLISAMADEFHYESEGRTACVVLSKASAVQQRTALKVMTAN
jgi:CheY-like chemotaxis protein